MEVLEVKFKTNSNNDELEIVEYFVSDLIKQKFKNAKSDNTLEIKAKLYGVIISNVADSFMIKYARYISIEHISSVNSLQDITDGVSGNVKTNISDTSVTKRGNMPKSLDIVMKKLVLCVINLNFHKLANGEDVAFDDSLFFIPVEFVYGKKDLNKHFKFYFNYRDNTKTGNDEYVTINFQIVE